MREKINVRNAIITAVIGWVVTLVLDAIRSEPFSTTIKDLLAGIGGLISRGIQLVIKFMNMSIKLWFVLLIILILVIIKRMIEKISIDPTNSNQKKSFESYTEDTIKSWRWTWRWGKSNGIWVVRDLTPYCPKCNSTLLQYDNRYMGEYSVECPLCTFKKNYIRDQRPDKITQLIIDKANRMEENRIKESS